VLIDTHCHLGDAKFDEDRAEVVSRARHAGVGHIVIVAESAPASERALALAERFDLTSTAGVHPHDAASWTPDVAARTEAWLHLDRVVAVGETGLDYHYDHSPRDVQRRAFAEQLALATKMDLPVVIHSRDADADMAAMLRETEATCILHSFSSGPDVLQVGLEIDAFVSFSGMVTFKSWGDRDAVLAVPANRILVETDAPYLAPVPHRGRRNEPAFVTQVAARVAELRGVTPEAIAHLTTANATACFGSRVAQSAVRS
jgi:TatD DNase family protein